MSKENGGPAFPQHPEQDDVANFGGMTLRDYFASKASEEDVRHQGEIIRSARFNECGSSILPDDWRTTARYMHADAMLAERSKP